MFYLFKFMQFFCGVSLFLFILIDLISSYNGLSSNNSLRELIILNLAGFSFFGVLALEEKVYKK